MARSKRLQTALAARAEFKRRPEAFAKLGLSEAQFVLSRLRDAGFTVCEPLPQLRAPLHERLRGLVSVEPGRHEVGS